MRFYGIKNMYMGGIHTGIQCGHALGEIMRKYGRPKLALGDQHLINKHLCDTVWDFIDNHKTWILLDGGYASNLRSMLEVFAKHSDEFPFAEFHEEQEALDGALTAIGIILPPWIYDCRRSDDERGMIRYILREAIPTEGGYSKLKETIHNVGDHYFDLIHAVKSCKFAT